jgi:branched-chain amino acid transport system substrate-binding protein
MMRWATTLLIISWLILAAQCGVSPLLTAPYPPTPAPLAGPTLRVALLSPTTGELATFGRVLRNGSILALDEWNGRGGVLGRPIEWAVYEADCAFEAAQQATQQAISDGLQPGHG